MENLIDVELASWLAIVCGAVTWVIGKTGKIERDFLPAVSLIVGILAGILMPEINLLTGIVAGLAASGAYDLGKKSVLRK